MGGYSIQGLCPVCNLKYQYLWIFDYEERITLKCARCGDFTITKGAAGRIESQKLNSKISAWLRQENDSGVDVPEINLNYLEQIVAQLPTYSILEKRALLFKSICSRAELSGGSLIINSNLEIPIAWTDNEEQFKYLLGLLIEEELIRRTDGPQQLTDSQIFKFEITSKGWANWENKTQSTKTKKQVTFDIFISHASEDKESIARPLYNALVNQNISVWFDEAEIKLGDSLRRKIDEGLSKCKYGVVILSPHFLSKEWTQKELDGLIAKETASRKKAILPIWHDLDREILIRYSPLLADRMAGLSKNGISAIVDMIQQVLKQ